MESSHNSTRSNMTLYSREGCSPCATVKYFLDKLGAKYEIVDVDNPTNLKELIDKYKVMSVPVLVDGDSVVIGANLSAIRELLN